MKKIIAAVIGFGVGKYHAINISRIKKYELRYICDFNKSKKKEISKLFSNTVYLEEPSKIFNDNDVNLVVIASYDNYHYEHILKSINSNKNIFVEKPFCLTLNEFKNINRKLKNKKILISSNLVLRSNINFINLKKNLRKFGKVYYLEGDYNYGRLFKITNGWRGKIPYYSVFLGGGIHLLDLIIWLKRKKVLEVYCAGNNISSFNTKFKNDDFAIATLKFEDGSLAKITSNYGSVTNHHHLLKVYGTKKLFFLILKKITFLIVEKNIMNKKKEKFTNENKSRILLSFIKNIENGKTKSNVSFNDIKEVMYVGFAINESLSKNKLVKINY
jgi:predicted dehydrogenase